MSGKSRPELNGSKVPSRRPKRWWREPFLEILADYGVIGYACDAVGISRKRVSYARRKDPEFAARVEEARKGAIDRLEAEAVRRARKGVKKPIYQGGVLVGHERQYSDRLLEMLLRATRPEKFKNSQQIDARISRGQDEKSLDDAIDAVLERLASSGQAGTSLEIEGETEAAPSSL